MERYLLGMDMGTTNIKAVIFDENGTALAAASAPCPLLLPGPDRAEQRAEDWWEAAKQVLRQITGVAGGIVVSEIQGICISSHLPSLLPVDENGCPLRNALIWMDGRCWQELDELLAVVGRAEYSASAGAPPDVAFLPAKLLWYKKHEPTLFRKTHRVLQANGYINFKLTGVMAMDLDQAALCQCLDLRTGAWSEAISHGLDTPLARILPAPSPSDQVIGTVTGPAAAETGLRIGIPVVAGASDATASMYATGLCRLGEAAESSGTTSLVFMGHDEPTPTDLPIVARPCSMTGMPYLFNAPINTSGASVKWYLDTLGQAERDFAAKNNVNVYDHINHMALDAPAGSGGLLFFPYLLGERAPLWNAHAKGMFIGLSLNTRREELIRAIFEGTGFAIRHVFDTMKAAGGAAPRCLRIAGGGAKSRTWCRIKASILKIPVYILHEKNGDVPFGDALIAASGVGLFSNLSEHIERMVQVREVIEPVAAWSEVYDQLYPYYLDMYRKLDPELLRLKHTMEIITDTRSEEYVI